MYSHESGLPPLSCLRSSLVDSQAYCPRRREQQCLIRADWVRSAQRQIRRKHKVTVLSLSIQFCRQLYITSKGKQQRYYVTSRALVANSKGALVHNFTGHCICYLEDIARSALAQRWLCYRCTTRLIAPSIVPILQLENDAFVGAILHRNLNQHLHVLAQFVLTWLNLNSAVISLSMGYPFAHLQHWQQHSSSTQNKTKRSTMDTEPKHMCTTILTGGIKKKVFFLSIAFDKNN